jgi:hypothetical protein
MVTVETDPVVVIRLTLAEAEQLVHKLGSTTSTENEKADLYPLFSALDDVVLTLAEAEQLVAEFADGTVRRMSGELIR